MVEGPLSPDLYVRYLRGDWSCDVCCIVQYLLHVSVYFSCANFSFLAHSVSPLCNKRGVQLLQVALSQV